MRRLVLAFAIFMAFGLSVSAQVAKNADSGSYVKRFEKFVNGIAACDTLTSKQKQEATTTYRAYLDEYKIVKDSLSDEDVRSYSKCKVKYQKAMANVFVKKASSDVADTAEEVGNKVSKFFKKTKKKVQGAIEGFKDN